MENERRDRTKLRSDHALLTALPLQQLHFRGADRFLGAAQRDRSLITLAQCIALDRPDEMLVDPQGAIRNGVTKEELRELCLQSFLYCEGPASRDAFHMIKSALREIEALEKSAAGK